MRRPIWLVAAVITVVAVLTPTRPIGAADLAVFVGACAFDLDVTYSPPLMLVPGVPGTTHVSITTAASTCIVNESLVTSSLSGELGPMLRLVGLTCEGGTATGRGTFQSSAVGFPVTSLAMELVNTGGTMTVEASSQVYVFRGVGTFEQDPADTAACLSGTPVAATTWTGTMVFEDPTLPV